KSDSTWVDAGTGANVPTGPDGWSSPIGQSEFISKNGHTYVPVPCPPPTATNSTKPSLPLPPPPTPTPEPNPKILWDDPFDLFFGYAYNRAPDEAAKNLNGFDANGFINVK